MANSVFPTYKCVELSFFFVLSLVLRVFSVILDRDSTQQKTCSGILPNEAVEWMDTTLFS